MTDPARVEAHRIVYEGRVFAVHQDRVRLSNGQTVEMEVVRHQGSVVLLPMLDEATLVLVRQYRYSIDRWIWELPAGRIERGEDPDRAAHRECQEEIGYTPGGIELVAEFYPTPGFCDEVMKFYRLTELTKLADDAEGIARDPDEELTTRVVSLTEARAMLAAREIVDLKTMAGLTLLGRS